MHARTQAQPSIASHRHPAQTSRPTRAPRFRLLVRSADCTCARFELGFATVPLPWYAPGARCASSTLYAACLGYCTRCSRPTAVGAARAIPMTPYAAAAVFTSKPASLSRRLHPPKSLPLAFDYGGGGLGSSEATLWLARWRWRREVCGSAGACSLYCACV